MHSRIAFIMCIVIYIITYYNDMPICILFYHITYKLINSRTVICCELFTIAFKSNKKTSPKTIFS